MEHLTLGNRTIAYRQYGREVDVARPPVVLVHGAGGNHLVWPAALRHLPHTTVYAVDLPAHGASPGPGCATISAYSEIVRDFVDALELPWFLLAGHSMGGAIALDFALAYEHRLAAIALIGAGARMRVSSTLLDQVLHDFDAATAQIVTYSYATGVSVEEQERYLHWLREADPHTLYMDFVACHQFDVADRLGAVAGPALIVCGGQDQMVPPDRSRFLHEHIAGSELHLIDGAGHNVMIEQPTAVATLLDRFLTCVATPTS